MDRYKFSECNYASHYSELNINKTKQLNRRKLLLEFGYPLFILQYVVQNAFQSSTKKSCNRNIWVPHEISLKKQTQRFNICINLFFFKQECQPFIFALLCCKWWKIGLACYQEAKKTVVIIKWKSSANTNAMTKSLPCIRWNKNNIIHYKIMEHREIITAGVY